MPRRSLKTRPVSQSRSLENSGRRTQQCSAFLQTLLLELDGQARTRMSVRESMNPNLGVAHSVEICNELREAVDSEVSPPPPRCPMHSLTDTRNPSQPLTSGDEVPQAPVGSDEQGDMQLWMAVKKALQATESAAPQVAAGLIFVTGSCGMHIIDAKTDSTPHSLR